MDFNKVDSGIHMTSFSSKNVVEDFLKLDYEEGLRNEFSVMDALINRLSKDTISGKKRYKSFALGITDNVRTLGRSADRYELGFNDFLGNGVEHVEAEFDTTKLMATFSITDETLLKGTGDGSLIDVVTDSLDRMNMNLKHTMNRFTYGAPDGIIGRVKEKVVGDNVTAPFSLAAVTSADDKPTWAYPQNLYYAANKGGTGVPNVIQFKMSNSHSILPGMGIMIVHVPDGAEPTVKRIVGRVWQKVNETIHDEKLLMFVESVHTRAHGGEWVKVTADVPVAATIAHAADDTVVVYSRQITDTADVNAEYHGLEAIVVNPVVGGARPYDNIFKVDRGVYQQLRSTSHDLEGTKFVNEELLRDLADHISLTQPENTGVNLVASNHRIISTIEKSMYQFREYSLDNKANGFELGRPDIKFDNYQMMKDKYSRDNNVYMLDTNVMGELVRREFTWLTGHSGEGYGGILSRRDGTEMYEGIMNKYADMYVDAFRSHAVIRNAKLPDIGSVIAGTYANPA